VGVNGVNYPGSVYLVTADSVQHAYFGPPLSPAHPDDLPATGDHVSIVMFRVIAILLLAGFALLALGAWRRRQVRIVPPAL
jgi:hypothetical protein